LQCSHITVSGSKVLRAGVPARAGRGSTHRPPGAVRLAAQGLVGFSKPVPLVREEGDGIFHGGRFERLADPHCYC
jgi:hypothetical protein